MGFPTVVFLILLWSHWGEALGVKGHYQDLDYYRNLGSATLHGVSGMVMM